MQILNVKKNFKKKCLGYRNLFKKYPERESYNILLKRKNFIILKLFI